MSKRSTHPRVVVGVDGSPGSKVAVQWAARDAELRNVPLTLVHVVPATAGTWLESSMVPEWMRAQRARGRQVIDEALKIARESCRRGSAQIECEMPSAITVPALVHLSKDADLVVAGCLGTGTLRGRHLGSVSSGLIYHARCPVAVIHDGVQLTADVAQAPVLLGIDGSPESELATAIAFEEASRRKVGLTALHAWSDVSVFDAIVSLPGPGWRELRAVEDEILAERLAGWGERYPDVPVRRLIVRDEPARQLIDASESAQLVVVGSQGRGGFAGMLLGSVSAAVVLMARVPVIVAREPLA
ncbi:universal stress protein [Mycobacterium sp. 852002-51163_SCH5372311]|uniref:universal stress protein n=1 Tax=Mycobacterium sp. 852002-51163_SCH5372311 TaxID=1834097 RepID=UPI0007FF3A4A|nr:universal stress protein [Mycobacterium sp. 852002-51163_SCH5372311]OBF93807.1 universal stress protein [Mycobacterium sp. 852002-51163_SCH5372311]